MEIVMICESAQRHGGAESVAIEEAIELRRRGYRVGYIAASETADPSLVESGVELCLVPTQSFFETQGAKNKLVRLFLNPNISESVNKFLEKFEPKESVVHAHTLNLKLSSYVLKLAQDLGFATILHRHDYSSVCPTSLLYNHRSQEVCDLKPMSLSCLSCECQGQNLKYKLPKVTHLAYSNLVSKVYPKLSGVIDVSSLSSDLLSKSDGYKLKNKAIILGPQHVSQSARIEAEQNQNFLYVGRLTPEKAPRAFLVAAQSAGVPAIVCGDGPLRAPLEREFPTAKFLGWLSQDQLAEQWKQARAYVFPSKWYETYGLSVVEAMSRGIPVICSDRAGARQWIRDGENGLLWSPSDEDLLVNRIMQLKMDNELVKAFSEQAFAEVQRHPPTVSAHVNQLVEFYKVILG